MFKWQLLQTKDKFYINPGSLNRLQHIKHEEYVFNSVMGNVNFKLQFGQTEK